MEIKPINFEAPTEEAPAILLPVAASIFSERAARFASLADGQTRRLAAFSGAIDARPARRVAVAARTSPTSAAALEQARQHHMPPLNASAAERPAVWREVLRQLIAALLPWAPESSLPLLTGLAEADDIRLESLADGLLHGEPDPAWPASCR